MYKVEKKTIPIIATQIDPKFKNPICLIDVYIRVIRFHMRFPRDFLIELLVTVFAFKSFVVTVNPHMLNKILFPRKRL